MKRARGFTLIEIVIVLFILLLLLSLAVPSLRGVFADRRLRRSLDQFNQIARTAHERSLAEHQSYLIVWGKDEIALRPEESSASGGTAPIDRMPLAKSEKWALNFPAARTRNPAPAWIFWPSGNCEPVQVTFTGRDGTWTAEYSPLSGQGALTAYAAR